MVLSPSLECEPPTKTCKTESNIATRFLSFLFWLFHIVRWNSKQKDNNFQLFVTKISCFSYLNFKK